MIDKSNYGKFKQAYDKAVKTKQNSFLFEGNYVDTQYAKGVIEYWEMQHRMTKK